MKHILVVEDDPAVRAALRDTLEGEGYDVSAVESAERALAMLAVAPPDLVLSDIRMPGLDGIALLRLLKERTPGTDVILMTAYDDMPTVVTAMREGAFDFLPKPLDLPELRRAIGRAFEDRRSRERARRRAEEDAAPFRLDQLVGHDPRMLEIYKMVGQLAASRTTVLLRGETGTGKEVIARAIHYNSADAGEPFVAINCTALPENLLESELFGHVRGAFTGAVADRRGRFALAGRGTIFLDEIGDTTPALQAKLLRVLEDREFYAVGAERPERTEARVIAATHRPLEHLLETGGFREDLYYRLRVVEITVPPLRERHGDFALLADHLVRRAAHHLHRQPPVLDAAALEALRLHDWPGNVRELDNALTRAIVLATGGVIRPEHLLMAKRPGAPEPAGTLEDAERRHVLRVVESTGGHKARAAELLGISRPRLNRLLKKYGVG